MFKKKDKRATDLPTDLPIKVKTKTLKCAPTMVITSELTHLEIMCQDYTHDGQRYFNYEETKKIEESLTDGWRLPTRHEWVLLCEEFGQNAKGQLTPDILKENLQLKCNGYYHKDRDDIKGITSRGYWRSSTVNATLNNDKHTYLLTTSKSVVNPDALAWEDDGYAIRLVRDIKDDRCAIK